MNDTLTALKPLLYGLADASAFLFASGPGLALLAGILAVAALSSATRAVAERRLLAKAAGRDLGRLEAFRVAGGRLGATALEALSRLPLLAGLALVLLFAAAGADTLRRLDEYVANRERIAELQATVRNLERRHKVADVAVLEAGGGRFVAEFSYYEGGRARPLAEPQRIELRGAELFVDAVVCNFAYSEIAEGRARNLALPYRAFSDEVPQSEGPALALLDDSGVPLVFRLPPEELYGIAPERYAARIAEFSALLRSDEASRGAGIVRSLYGAAVHRPVRKGDRFSIWIEQSGGLTIKDAFVF